MLNPGDRIGDWIIDETLGEGGMGAVFRAHNVLSEKVTAAVKILKPHNMGDARKRFVREVELLASVQHPAVVRVLGCGEDEKLGLLFLAMELLEGEELTDRLKRGPLAFDEALKYFKMLGEGLLAAHEKGVVHRDIKPQNILICTDGTAKLLDFGIAMQQGGTKLTTGGLVPGTIAYMPPEVFGGQRPDHRADIYALGLVLWEALTGQEAYPEDGGLTPDQNTVKTMGSKLQAEAWDPGEAFPEPVRALIKKATDPEPDTRLNDLAPFVKVMATRGADESTIADLDAPAAGATYGFDLDAVEGRAAAQGADQAPVQTAAQSVAPAAAAPKAASGGGVGKWIAIAVVLLLLVGGGVALVAGGGVVLFGAGGAAAFLLASDAPAPPPSSSSDPSSNTGGGSSAEPVANTGPAAKGWMKGTSNGLPKGFPFSVPADAKISNAMSTKANGLDSAFVMFETAMATGDMIAHYKKEAKAQDMQVYQSESSHGATLSGLGTKSVFSCSIEEHKTAQTVTVTYMPDRGG